jgi:hypothetical protein
MMKISSGKRRLSAIEDYVEDCRVRGDPKKPIFANVAGFCRFAGISVPQFLAFRKRFSSEFEAAGAYFEDAALNSGATATLVGMYLRQYGFWGQATGTEVSCEHDLYSDGI